MENTNQDKYKLPLFEHSSDERIVSYAIYLNKSKYLENIKYVLLKYVSIKPSTCIQRDESFVYVSNDVNDLCHQMREQGFAIFSKHPTEHKDLVCSFI